MLRLDNINLCNSCFSDLEVDSVVCAKCGYVDGQESEIPMVLPIGSILLGKYVIGKTLGKGGFGVTYLAYSIKDNKNVAIKEYLPDNISHRNTGDTFVTTFKGVKEEAFKSGLEKFFEEAKTLSKFKDHPNIINVQEFFYENNTAYFAMDYIEGVDLKRYISKKGGRLNENETIKIILPLMDSLIAVHGAGLLHRDISPDNIYIANSGTVKLLDFGSARQVLGEQSKSLSVVLKPGFAPIEQYQTRGNQGPWTDVYSLAATIYYCLTGQIPEASMNRIDDDNLQSLAQNGVEVSTEVEKAIAKALSVRPANRFQSIIEFKSAIRMVAYEKNNLAGSAIINHTVNPENANSYKDNNNSADEEKQSQSTFISFFKKKNIKVLLVALAIIILFGVGTFALIGNKKNSNVSNNGGGGNNLKTSSGTSTNLNEKNSSTSQLNSDSGSSEDSSNIVNSDNVSNEQTSSTTVEVVVPNVVGLISDEAMNTIRKVGLKSSTSDRYSDTVLKGRVVSQSIPGGEKRISGSTINLTISKGKEVETVPSIIGKTATKASSDLISLGFDVSFKQQIDDDKIPGTVIAQSVDAGQKIKYGSTIVATVCINSGTVAVPNLVGKTSSKAASDLTAAGLTSTQTQLYSDTISSGIVISQGNAPGSKIPKGSTINIFVSKGKSTWSSWTDLLSAGVNSTNYYIEEKTQYQYRNRETTTNMESSLTGWIANGSAWSDTAFENSSFDYASFPVGYSKLHWTYTSYNKAPLTTSSTASVKTVASNSATGSYIYWHWCTNRLDGPWDRFIEGSQTNGCNTFHAFTYGNITYIHSYYKTYKFSNPSVCKDTYWWRADRITIYKCTYQKYRMNYFYYRWNNWSAWQDATVTATSDREVNTKKVYRYRLKQ